jgi:hypothetical protein
MTSGPVRKPRASSSAAQCELALSSPRTTRSRNPSKSSPFDEQITMPDGGLHKAPQAYGGSRLLFNQRKSSLAFILVTVSHHVSA